MSGGVAKLNPRENDFSEERIIYRSTERPRIHLADQPNFGRGFRELPLLLFARPVIISGDEKCRRA